MLGDDPGTGKTIQALVANRLIAPRRTIVLCPAYVTGVWSRHLRDWINQEHVVAYHSERVKRQRLMRSNTPVLVTNHESLRGNYPELLEREVDHLIVDEAHRFQGRKSKQTEGLRQLRKRAGKVTLLSGSLIWNRPDSIWSLLNVLYPRRFGSYWTFVNHFCQTRTTPWGTSVVGLKRKRADQLHWILAPLLLRRRKSDVLPDLPEKLVQKVDWIPTQRQREELRSLRDELRLAEQVFYFDWCGTGEDA